MDSKDFKKMIEKKLKETFSNIQSNYCASQRNSRPRVKNNILQPEQNKDNNHCVVYDDKDYI